MQTKKTVLIDGDTFEILPLPTSEAIPVLERALAIIGPCLGKAMEGWEGGGLSGLKDAAIATAVAECVKALGSPGMLSLIADLFVPSTNIRQAGSKGMIPLADVYELVFSGRPDVLVLWVRACLDANGFARFFSMFGLARNARPADEEGATQ